MSLDALASPQLVWGLFPRLLAGVYIICFGSLLTQVLALHGQNGIMPFALRRARIEADFGWKRFYLFPSLLWISDRDETMLGLLWLGIAAALYVLVGGPYTPYALLLCYLVLLSFDVVMELIFPWDCILLEAGLLSILLPPLSPLALSAVDAPAPALVWVLQLIVFRVLLGFGRVKFLGSSKEDLGYLKGFLIGQPLPSKFAWYLHKAPIGSLKTAMVAMFIVECILPFAVFVPGPLSVAAAVVISLFVCGIWLCSSFGYFSLIVIVMCVTWLDVQTPRQLAIGSLFSAGQPWVVNAIAVAHVLASLLSFPCNSFAAHTWLRFTFFERVRTKLLTLPIRWLRALHPIRWVHAYGVFPPKTYPGVKIVPVVEASWDGHTFQTCEPNFNVVKPSSPPRTVSPHHARGDTAALYEAFSATDASVLGAIAGTRSPYGFGKRTGLGFAMQRMLEGRPLGRALMKRGTFDPERDGPPVAVRARTYMLEPTTAAEKARTGRWWRRRCIGPHIPPLRLEEDFWQTALPPPELWHWEDVVWQRRSTLGRLMKRAAAGEDALTLVLEGRDDLDQPQVDAFFTHFTPFVRSGYHEDWRGVRDMVMQARRRWGREQLYRFECIAGRLSVFLRARLEPLFLEHGVKPVFFELERALDVKSYYHLGMLTHHILCQGKDAFDAVYREPAQGQIHAEAMTLASGHFLQVLFRYEVMVLDAQKLRLLHNYTEVEGRAPLTEEARRFERWGWERAIRMCGSLEASVFLAQRLTEPEHAPDVPERWPSFRLNARGEVVVTEPRPSVAAAASSQALGEPVAANE